MSSDALQTSLVFFRGSQGESCGNCCRKFGPERHRTSLPARMHSTGKQKDVRPCRGVNPQRSTGESSVPEGSHREQSSSIGEERRIEIASRDAQCMCCRL